MHSSHDQLDLLPQQIKPQAPAGPTNSGLVNAVDMLQEGFVPITLWDPKHNRSLPLMDLKDPIQRGLGLWMEFLNHKD